MNVTDTFKFWEARSSFGRQPIYDNPEDLWKACVEYFEWNADNPLYEEKGFAYEGLVTRERFARMRAMTLRAMTRFIGMEVSSWYNYRKDPRFTAVCNMAEDVIKDQKFEGAAAGFLNANLIMRDLGMAEKTEVSGPDGGPMQHEVSARDILANKLAGIAARRSTSGDTE